MSEDGSAPDGKVTSAQAVISAFGGIRPMASKLGVAVSTVQGWKERGVIPKGRHGQILEVAAREGIDLEPGVFAEGGRSPKEPSQTDAPVIDATPDSVVIESPAASPDEDTEAKPSEAPADKPRPSGKPAGQGSVPPSGTRAHRRSGGGFLVGGIVVGAAVAALGFLTAVLTVDLWRPLLGVTPDAASEATQAALEDLGERLAAQDRRLETLGEELGSLPRTSGDAAGLAGELEALAAATETLGRRMAELEAGPSLSTDLESRLARLESGAAGEGVTAEALAAARRETRDLGARMSRLEEELAAQRDRQTEVGTTSGRQVLVLLGVAALREAVDAGRPYQDELDRLRDATGGDPAFKAPLDQLAAKAETGVATLPELRTAFAAIAKDVVVGGTADRYDGWIGGTMRRLLDAVTIRPVGQVEGDDVGAVVARGEQRLAEGDLAAAVDELGGLEGAAAEVAADWLEVARSRLGAQEAVSVMIGLLVDRTSAADG